MWEPPASLWPNNGSRRVSAGKIRVTGKTPGGTPGFRGWISGVGEVHQKLRFLSCELVFILALGGHLGLGPLFGDPWRTTETPLTDPLEEQPFHHRMTCPGCPPPLQNTNNYKNQTSNILSKNSKYSSSFSELSEILKSPNTYNSCAGESPGLIHAHTLRCPSKKSGKPHQAKKK